MANLKEIFVLDNNYNNDFYVEFDSFIKIIGAFIILSRISMKLTIQAFILVPFMTVYAYLLNKTTRLGE